MSGIQKKRAFSLEFEYFGGRTRFLERFLHDVLQQFISRIDQKGEETKKKKAGTVSKRKRETKKQTKREREKERERERERERETITNFGRGLQQYSTHEERITSWQ